MSTYTKIIDGVEYTLKMELGENIEVEYANDVTGLNRVVRFAFAVIGQPPAKQLDTEIILYDRYPNGDLVKVDKSHYPTPKNNYDVFEATLGVPIKQSILNGILRIYLGKENAFDQTGQLIQ